MLTSSATVSPGKDEDKRRHSDASALPPPPCCALQKPPYLPDFFSRPWYHHAASIRSSHPCTVKARWVLGTSALQSLCLASLPALRHLLHPVPRTEIQASPGPTLLAGVLREMWSWGGSRCERREGEAMSTDWSARSEAGQRTGGTSVTQPVGSGANPQSISGPGWLPEPHSSPRHCPAAGEGTGCKWSPFSAAVIASGSVLEFYLDRNFPYDLSV